MSSLRSHIFQYLISIYGRKVDVIENIKCLYWTEDCIGLKKMRTLKTFGEHLLGILGILKDNEIASIINSLIHIFPN